MCRSPCERFAFAQPGALPVQIRQKFVLVSWCGPEVKALKKAKMSVHKVGRTRPAEA